MKNEPIVIECLYHAPVNAVWNAITVLNEMRQWYFKLAEFKAREGFEFEFSGGKDQGNQYLHKCKITEVIPGKKLTYSWRYEGYEGISYVTFELLKEGNNTRLILTHSGLDSFPQHVSDLQKENFVEGWTYITGTSLKIYLEKSAAPE
jgi:uncharacterized protein YndB with AHSA1/START domain